MVLISFLKSRVYIVLQNLGTLALLLIVLPFNLLKVCSAIVWSFCSKFFHKKVVTENSKNILLTGAKMSKCLQLARSFQTAGHRVFLLETDKYWLSGNRFSNAVTGGSIPLLR